MSLVILSDPEYLKTNVSDQRVAPTIRRGATITTNMLQTLTSKNCNVVPMLMPGKPKQLKALTQFSRKQTLMLPGRVYSVVDDVWLPES